MITIFGIPNCDTIKKTRKWFDSNNIVYHFHDFRTQGISEERLKQWCADKGWETLLNKRSTTWKELPIDEQQRIKNTSSAIALMLQNPTIIKRPVIEIDDKIVVIGYDDTIFKKIFL